LRGMRSNLGMVGVAKKFVNLKFIFKIIKKYIIIIIIIIIISLTYVGSFSPKLGFIQLSPGMKLVHWWVLDHVGPFSCFTLNPKNPYGHKPK